MSQKKIARARGVHSLRQAECKPCLNFDSVKTDLAKATLRDHIYLLPYPK